MTLSKSDLHMHCIRHHLESTYKIPVKRITFANIFPLLFWVSVHYTRGRDDHVAEFDGTMAKAEQASSERWEMLMQFCRTR